MSWNRNSRGDASNEEFLREKLLQASNKIREQQEYIEAMQASPAKVARVVTKVDGAILAIVDGHTAFIPTDRADLNPGAIFQVRETMEGLVLGEPLDNRFDCSGTVVTVVEDKGSFVLVNQDSKISAAFTAVAGLEPGDRVIMADGCITKKLTKADKRFTFEESTGVSWKDVGGLHEAKEALQDAIETPWNHRELFEAYGKKVSKGVLLYGPPGCGKTMLAKAAATSLANIHGRESGGFIYVKGPEVLSMWVGESESNIRGLFEQARAFKAERGFPAILFIDEADALMRKRGTGRSSDMEQTVVTSFLAEMDGLDDSSAIVLLSTNRAESLDSAIVREGRIDKKIKVTRPDASTAEEVAALHLEGRPSKARDLAKVVAQEIFADSQVVGEYRTENRDITLRLRNFVSGALIAELVERASSTALRRDVDKGKSKPSGLTSADIKTAAASLCDHQKGIDHQGILKEML